MIGKIVKQQRIRQVGAIVSKADSISRNIDILLKYYEPKNKRESCPLSPAN